MLEGVVHRLLTFLLIKQVLYRILKITRTITSEESSPRETNSILSRQKNIRKRQKQVLWMQREKIKRAPRFMDLTHNLQNPPNPNPPETRSRWILWTPWEPRSQISFPREMDPEPAQGRFARITMSAMFMFITAFVFERIHYVDLSYNTHWTLGMLTTALCILKAIQKW